MSGAFASELRARGGQLGASAPDSSRTWFYLPYDQLNEGFEAWRELPPTSLGFVFVESRSKAQRRPYHRQKLALILANQRHFALEQAARGVQVDYLVGDAGYAEQLAEWCAHTEQSLRMQEAAERELRLELQPLIDGGQLEVLPHTGWLTTEEQFAAACPKRPYRMDAFYRRVRRDEGWLMEDGKPLAGKWSLDAENRQPWRGEPTPPERPRFPLDPIKEEVAALIESDFAEHPGVMDLATLPATQQDAEAAWAWALDACLEYFGPYEDAMTEASSGLFHTRVSPLLNLHRLMPRRVVDEVLASDAPLNSVEGFVRQVAGWREFVRHVHRETDGFAGLVREGGTPLPAAYWGQAPSGLRCLDHTVDTVWEEAYSHHITRLMVLGNLATLLDCDARELSDWFWVAYQDAYDWVVEPNVLGMATWSTAGVMTTKPYISGAAYLDRMGDHCRACRFHPKEDCPVTPLYWAWLDRHQEELEGNGRMAMPLRSLAKRPPERRQQDQDTFQDLCADLAAGKEFRPREC